MELRVQIQGLRKIEAAMRELPRRLDRKLLDAGLFAGAQVVAEEAQLMAPELRELDPRWSKGALKRAIRATSIKPSQYAAEAIVGVRKLSSRQIAAFRGRQGKRRRAGKGVRSIDPRDAYYWFFVEFGTAKRRAANGGRGFLRPAFEARKTFAVDAAIKVFRDRIQLEMDKLGRTALL
jgi:HK97 gp10 family phage protein